MWTFRTLWASLTLRTLRPWRASLTLGSSWPFRSGFSLWTLWPFRTLGSLWPFRSGFSSRSLWASSPTFTLRTLRAGLTLGPLRPFRSLWPFRSGFALRTSWSGLTLRPLFTGFALRTLWSLRTSSPTFTLRSSWTCFALRSLWSDLTLWSLRAGFTLGSPFTGLALRTLRAGLALRTCLSLRSPVALITLWTLRTLGTGLALRTLGSDRPFGADDNGHTFCTKNDGFIRGTRREDGHVLDAFVHGIGEVHSEGNMHILGGIGEIFDDERPHAKVWGIGQIPVTNYLSRDRASVDCLDQRRRIQPYIGWVYATVRILDNVWGNSTVAARFNAIEQIPDSLLHIPAIGRRVALTDTVSDRHAHFIRGHTHRLQRSAGEGDAADHTMPVDGETNRGVGWYTHDIGLCILTGLDGLSGDVRDSNREDQYSGHDQRCQAEDPQPPAS